MKTTGRPEYHHHIECRACGARGVRVTPTLLNGFTIGFVCECRCGNKAKVGRVHSHGTGLSANRYVQKGCRKVAERNALHAPGS